MSPGILSDVTLRSCQWWQAPGVPGDWVMSLMSSLSQLNCPGSRFNLALLARARDGLVTRRSLWGDGDVMWLIRMIPGLTVWKIRLELWDCGHQAGVQRRTINITEGGISWAADFTASNQEQLRFVKLRKRQIILLQKINKWMTQIMSEPVCCVGSAGGLLPPDHYEQEKITAF